MIIDFYISSLSGGGAEKVLVNIANKLAEIGNEVTIISLEKRPQFYKPKENVGLIQIKNSGNLVFVKDFLAIRNRIRERKADVAISFLYRCNVLVLLASLFSKQRVIVSDRNNPLKEHSKVLFLLQNLLYLRANGIVVQTNQIKGYYWGKLQKKITVIENPIDTASLEQQLDEIPRREKTIISMGRLEPQKDFETLIKAFSVILSLHPDWIVKVFGVGDMYQELVDKTVLYGVYDNFKFCGRTETPFAEMKKASVFVLSSFYEGFPNVLCEAMYAGDLCIASDCVSGPRELIESEKNGWLFEIGNADQLAGILDKCIRNEKNLAQVRDEAEKTVKRLYLEEIIKLWEKMFKNIVGQECR